MRAWMLAVALLLSPACSLAELCVDGEVGCAADACHDQLLGGDESDRDCGGSCAPCEAGAMCRSADDCRSGRCIDGRCCEPPCLVWSHAAGSPGLDRATSAVALDDGGWLVAGELSGTLDLGAGPLVSAGERDVFLASFAADGTCRWSRRMGGAGDDHGPELVRGATGRLFLAGTFGSTPFDHGSGSLQASGGFGDVFALHLDEEGRVLGARAFSSQGVHASCTGAAPAAGGGLVLVGSIGRLALGDGRVVVAVDHPSGARLDGYVLSLDADLAPEWAHRLGGTEDDEVQTVTVGPDGDVYVTLHYGTADATVAGEPLPPPAPRGSAVARFSAAGALASLTAFPSLQATVARADASGDRWLAGSFRDRLDLGSGLLLAEGDPDLWVARVGGDGVARWAVRAGDNAAVVSELVLDGDGVVVTGTFTGDLSFEESSAPLAGVDSAFFARLTSAGVPDWAWSPGGIGGHLRLVPHPSGQMLALGGYAGALQILGEPSQTRGNFDAFVLAFWP